VFLHVCVFEQMWDKMFVPLHCLNFGIGSDQTQHVLWRVQNGELDNFSPKASYLHCVSLLFYLVHKKLIPVVF